jgi:hypothetical protein
MVTRVLLLVFSFGVLSAVILQGSFLHTILTMAAAIWVLGTSFLVLAVMAGLAIAQKRKLGHLAWPGLIWCSLAAALVLSYGLGNGIRLYRGDLTRNYVARAIVSIKEVRIKEGSYPAALPVGLVGAPPAWAYAVDYSSDGKEFRFAYDDSVGLMNAYEFLSSQPFWRYCYA